MKQCSNCKREFYHKEFVWHGGEGQFCSVDCLPEGVLDETYAMDYVFLVERFNEIQEKCWSITSYEERQNLMSEIDDCIVQCEEYQLGDLEGSFYKYELRKLYNDFSNLQDKVWSCFLTKGSLLRDIGFYVNWEGISEISLQAANKLKQRLQDVINEANCSVSIIYNQELDPINYSRNIVYVMETRTMRKMIGDIRLLSNFIMQLKYILNHFPI